MLTGSPTSTLPSLRTSGSHGKPASAWPGHGQLAALGVRAVPPRQGRQRLLVRLLQQGPAPRHHLPVVAAEIVEEHDILPEAPLYAAQAFVASSVRGTHKGRRFIGVSCLAQHRQPLSPSLQHATHGRARGRVRDARYRGGQTVCSTEGLAAFIAAPKKAAAPRRRRRPRRTAGTRLHTSELQTAAVQVANQQACWQAGGCHAADETRHMHTGAPRDRPQMGREGLPLRQAFSKTAQQPWRP